VVAVCLVGQGQRPVEVAGRGRGVVGAHGDHGAKATAGDQLECVGGLLRQRQAGGDRGLARLGINDQIEERVQVVGPALQAPVPGGLSDGQHLRGRGLHAVQVAEAPLQETEQPDAGASRRGPGAGHAQRSFHGLSPFPVAAPHKEQRPVAPGEVQRRFGVVPRQGPVQRGPEVVMLGGKMPDDHRGDAEICLFPLSGRIEADAQVGIACRGGLFGPGQFQGGEVADGLKQVVARGRALQVVLDDHQRLVRQALEEVEDGGGFAARPRTRPDVFSGVEGEAPGEDGQPAEQDPLFRGEQVMAPRHRRLEGLLAAHATTGSAGEQAEPVLEPVQDLLGREHPDPGGGQLDGQRDPVEAGADLGHDGGGGVRHGEVRPGLHGPVDEEPHRVVAAQRFHRAGVALEGQRQGRDPPGHLATDPEGLPAGGHDGNAGTGPQDRLAHRRAGVEDVLAVVQDHQEIPGGQMGGEALGGGAPGGVADLEHAQHGLGHQCRVGQRCELHPPGSVGMAAGELSGDRGGQASLADTAGPGEGHQAVLAGQAGQVGELGLPADERGEVDGQVVGDRVEGPQRREFPPQAGMADLEYLLGPAEVLQTVGAERDQRHAVGQVVPSQVSGRS
jgi:hypothetical protein